MTDTDGETAPAGESAAARQLRVGFAWLRFEPDLERAFRHEYLRSALPQVRRNLFLGAFLVIAFGFLNVLVVGHAPGLQALLYQFGLLLPIVMLGAGSTFLPDAEKIYPSLVMLLAPAFGLGVCAFVCSRSSVDMPVMFSTVLLTSVYLYFLVGLHFSQAILTTVLVWAGYLWFAIRAGLPATHVAYNAMALLFSDGVGAMVLYGLELDRRRHFLQQLLLTETASRDGLTGLYNRRFFDERLESLWRLAQREGATLALMLVDIDCFKRFNDSEGHQAGDGCLRHVAGALARAARRPLDFVARYGGEEFAIVLYAPDRPYLQEVSNRVHSNVATLALLHGDSPVSRYVTVSVGVGFVEPTQRRSARGLVQLADEALYQAKNDGRSRSVFSETAYRSLVTGVFRLKSRAAG